MSCKNIVILGSTGSIGVNTLKVIERFKDKFKVIGLTAYNNCELLSKQIEQFKPKYVCVAPSGIAYLKKNCRQKNFKLLDVYDESNLENIVSLKNVDVVVIGMRSSAALRPFIAAVKAGKTVAPANKEALVIAGEIIMKLARKHNATVVPVDSEQSAIFQCLQGQDKLHFKKVILTASGGALLNVPSVNFDNLTKDQILNHPRWKMGQKITVDSATLLNKGFEVIEAMRLFDLDISQIDVLVHPEAIIHSMVEFIDGSIIAQLGITDMRLPIQYAITYPERLSTGLKSLDFVKLGKLTFLKPDLKRFPFLKLSIDVAKKGKTYPCVLNASDEIAVDAFLKGNIKFTDIYKIVSKVVLKHKAVNDPELKDILDADNWARIETEKLIKVK